mmetsp:Transcript_15684/g.61260  ORF Transcript_15684/g.61260 Transcript_15684/m.61260 type:complete len:213 (-) Transcript_15684:237-875(-)
MMEERRPRALLAAMVAVSWAAQSQGTGCSGKKQKSAPAASAALRASHPQFLPMTSTTNSLWCELAVELSWSMASQILASAESHPIVMSVSAMSLSMLPTRPTACSLRASPSRPSQCSRAHALPLPSSSRRPAHASQHSCSAAMPVREPSPPITTTWLMPASSRLATARCRPSGVRNSADRAVPSTVPPRWRMPPTSPQEMGEIQEPPRTRPS